MLTKEQEQFIDSYSSGQLLPINAGHMLYERSMIHHKDSPWFVKAHNSSLFTIDSKRDEALRYLEKEHAVYQHLDSQQYPHIPEQHHYKHGVLLLSGLRPEDGWHWKAPHGTDTDTYITSVLDALTTLESVPSHTMFHSEPSVDFFWEKGWGSGRSITDAAATHYSKWADLLHTPAKHAARRLVGSTDAVSLRQPPIIGAHMSHHDMRQSNLAWHPTHGTVIVDWSWASHGVKHADATTFLVDLHKAGVNVDPYLVNYFNIDYAKLLIGFWLLRVGEPSAQGNDDVRFHQFVSAISAFELIERLAAHVRPAV